MSKDLLLLFNAMNEKPIAYHRIYSKITGSITAGILLSQIVYWDKAMKGKEFYKTDIDFMDELSMGSKELKNAKKRLVELNLVDIKRKGVPAKTFYKLNINNVVTAITSCAERDELVMPKGTNKTSRKVITITESNSENTSENKQHNNTINNITSDEVNEIINYFNLKFNSKYRLTPDRNKKIKLRLKTYSLLEIKKAIDKLSSSPFHTGDNERKWKASIDFIIRNDEKIDEFLNASEIQKKLTFKKYV